MVYLEYLGRDLAENQERLKNIHPHAKLFAKEHCI